MARRIIIVKQLIVKQLYSVYNDLMKAKTKKKPSDYAQFAIRVPPDVDLASILKAVDTIRERVNAKKKDDEKIVNKNDVVFEALAIGLSVLEKRR